jgi:hemerythrin superfamily protein
MHALLNKLAPTATDMIRADHTRVLAAFHRYTVDERPQAKQALVNTICLALEVHAQIEEEIFYPAMREVNSTLVENSVPEHEEMRRRIAMLRRMDPASEQYDMTFMELMRNVMHHVADEETMLLPNAERLLADRLGELGARMSRRRMQLKMPRAGEMVTNTARAMSPGTMLMAAGALAAGVLVFASLKRRPRWRL